jgi:hypothetical protein
VHSTRSRGLLVDPSRYVKSLTCHSRTEPRGPPSSYIIMSSHIHAWHAARPPPTGPTSMPTTQVKSIYKYIDMYVWVCLCVCVCVACVCGCVSVGVGVLHNCRPTGRGWDCTHGPHMTSLSHHLLLAVPPTTPRHAAGGAPRVHSTTSRGLLVEP